MTKEPLFFLVIPLDTVENLFSRGIKYNGCEMSYDKNTQYRAVDKNVMHK